MSDNKRMLLITPTGFLEQFYEFCKTSYSYKHAYEQTEGLYENTFGLRKYSSYECFQVVKCKMRKSKKESHSSLSV